jgi:hypothetical protein
MGLATVPPKGLMLMANGALASVTHLDTLRRGEGGGRISHRVVLAQRTPLGGAYLAHVSSPSRCQYPPDQEDSYNSTKSPLTSMTT